MRVYKISVYNRYWRLLHEDYMYLEDNQAAEIAAQDMEADYSATFYEWERVR